MPEISYLLAVQSPAGLTDVNKRTFVICLFGVEERLPAIINNSFDKVISGLPVPSPPSLELELEIQFVSELQLNLAGLNLRREVWLYLACLRTEKLRQILPGLQSALGGLIYQSRQMVDI